MSDLIGEDLFQVDLSQQRSLDMLQLNNYGACAKRTIDIIVSLILLFVLFPLLLCLILIIKFDGGPAFFFQRRVGRSGASFRCVKFRTMSIDAECRLNRLLAVDPVLAAEWAATNKLKRDPRVTRAGQMLRRTSLDELPQLWNVLRGEMSVIGPRPIVETEIRRFGCHISYYYRMRPGMTGLWQVTGRSNTTYRRRIALDAWYVKSWSLSKDFKILAATLPAILRGQGAH